MSRRLPASPIVLTFLLLAGGLLVPLLAPSAQAFGERPYDRNQVVSGTAHLDVYAGQSVAQSFVASEAYLLLNLTLRLRNSGSLADSVNLTVRADASGAPGAGVLAWSNLFVASSGSPANVAVPLTPAVALGRGSTYWIVATHTGILAEAYEWHHSNANVYPQGKPMVNQGAGWIDVGVLTDLYFVTFGREVAANVSVDLATGAGAVPVEGLATFTVFYNNTGTQAAARVWINLTVPADLVYVSDTSVASTTGYPRYTFDGVTNDPHSFQVTFRVRVGTEPGRALTVIAALSYVDASWAPRPSASDSVTVVAGLAGKQLYLVPRPGGPPNGLTPTRPTGGLAVQNNLSLSQGNTYDFDLNPSLARAFQEMGGSVVLYLDSRSHSTRRLDLNLALMDWNGASLVGVTSGAYSVTTNNFNDYEPFTFPFSAFNHSTPSGWQIRLRIALLGSSDDDGTLAMNSTQTPSRVDLTTSTYVRVDQFQVRDGLGLPTVWSPKDSLVVRVNASDPFGIAEIAGVRLNVTAPGGGAVVTWTWMAVLTTDPGSNPSWRLYEHVLAPLLANGTYLVRVTAVESNGVVDAAEGSALVRAPLFQLEKTASASNVKSGDRFHYYLRYNNTGTGTANRVWINDTLPSQLNFITSTAEGARTGTYNWSWTNLGPGAYMLDIEVQVRGGVSDPYFRNTASLNYTDEKGYRWDMTIATVDVVLRGPVITISKTSAKSVIHANESIVYAFQVTNTGDAAQTLWLNDTLPAGLAYVSDTAGNVGGTTTLSGNVVRIVFGTLPPGATWPFSMTARAGPSLNRGTVLVNVAVLEYTNANGVSLPPKTSTRSVTVVSPLLENAALMASLSVANPGDVVPVVLDFANLGNEAARDTWINLTLDPYLGLVNASAPAAGSGPDIRFTLSDVAVGSNRLSMNVTVLPGVPDRRDMTIGGDIQSTDGFGNPAGDTTVAPETVMATAPRITLGVAPGTSTVEAGTRFTYTVNQANAGSGTAGDVWLNLTLPASFVYVSDTSDGTHTLAGSTHSWYWQDRGPGSTSFTLDLLANVAASDGSSSNLTFRVEYTDVHGNARTPTIAVATANFVGPSFVVSIEADRPQVLSGDTVTYTLRVRNAGSMSARYLWLLDSVESRLEIVQFTSRVRGEGAPDLNWTFVDVQPGQQEVITLVVRVAKGLDPRTPISNVIEAVFTNSQGVVLGYVRSVPVTIFVAADLFPILYIVVGGLAIGAIAVVIVYRRMNVDIEEVFLVYRDGVLMYHLSRSLVQDKDEDVLSGMLTAVQEFVRDAFRYGEHRELHQLDFGDYQILIERGKMVYLAVVYSGKESSAIRRKVRSVLDDIESTCGRQLEAWDGDMEKVVGARDVIRDHLFKANGRLPKPQLQPT